MVGADCHGHTRRTQGGDGWQVGVAQGVVGPGQQHRHRAGGLHGGNALGVQVFDVVTRQGAVACRQGRAPHVRQLLGVQLHRQAQRLCGLEHLFGLGQREADAFAEHVHRVHQALGGQRGQHLVAHQVDVSLAAARILGRQGVGTQEGGAHCHAKGLAQTPRHAQLLAFVGQRQAIAGLDFNGTHALGQQGLQPGGRQRKQGVFVGLAGGAHAGHNATARPGHVFVTGTGQAHRKLMGPLTAVHQVRVAIHQARAHPGAACAVAWQVRAVVWQVGLGAEPADRAVRHHQRRVTFHAAAFGQGTGQQTQLRPHTVGARGVYQQFSSCLRCLNKRWMAFFHVFTFAGVRQPPTPAWPARSGLATASGGGRPPTTGLHPPAAPAGCSRQR